MGQAGINIGLEQWKLFENENKIMKQNDSFFHERISGTYQPRSILVDSDPSNFERYQFENPQFSQEQFVTNGFGSQVTFC